MKYKAPDHYPKIMGQGRRFQLPNSVSQFLKDDDEFEHHKFCSFDAVGKVNDVVNY